ncbi:MAG: DUF5798 family protein [Haloarculaceae archaeon]
MVGLGNTAKKVQKMVDAAEKLYAKMNELREEVDEMRQKLDATSETVSTLERDAAEQRAILEALADEQGLDVDQVLADAAIDEPPADGADAAEDSDVAGGAAAEPED